MRALKFFVLIPGRHKPGSGFSLGESPLVSQIIQTAAVKDRKQICDKILAQMLKESKIKALRGFFQTVTA